MSEVGRITFGPKLDGAVPWSAVRRASLARVLNELRVQPERENAILVRDREVVRWNAEKRYWE